MAKRNEGNGKGKTTLFLKLFIIVVFFTFFAFVVYNGSVSYLRHGAIFDIKSVELDPYLQFIDNNLLDDLVGQNIFDVDLTRVHKKLRSRYPDIDQLRVYRKFPNKVYIAAPRREALAQLKIGKQDVLLDKNGVVFSSRVPAGQLPFLRTGEQYSGAVFGRPLRSSEISAALQILKAIRANEHLRLYTIETIDVTNLSKITFSTSEHLNIIVDRENIRQRIDTLGVLLSQGNIDLKQTSYIDLRFKEPVLGKN